MQVIPFVGKPPVLDGRLDDAVWKQVKPFSAFVIAGTRSRAPVQTEMTALFTRKGLYFGIVCFDADTSKLKAKCRTHDGEIWSDDSVEIFINPEDKSYYQLVFNPEGARVDLAYPTPDGLRMNQDWNPNPEWVVKTRIAKHAWTAEVEIPFASLWGWKLPPQPGEHFRLKICRTVQDKTGNTDDKLLTSWSHLPRAVFSENDGWRTARLGGRNLIRDADFTKWLVRKDRVYDGELYMGGYWRYEHLKRDGTKIGTWETVADPEPGVAAALKLRNLKPNTANPRLFVRVPWRPGHRYRFSMKVKGRYGLDIHTVSRPWIVNRHNYFMPPDGRWKTFTPVGFECEVGKSARGRDVIGYFFINFAYLNGKRGHTADVPKEVLITDIELVELKSAVPQQRTEYVKYHRLESLAESNFGIKPFELMNKGPDNSRDSSRVIYRDSATGFEIWKVTHYIYLDRLLATGVKSWSPDGRLFAWTSFWRPDSAMHAVLTADAGRVIPVKAVSGVARWHSSGHRLMQLGTQLVSYDPVAKERMVVFDIPKDKYLPGRNWTHYSPESNRLIQYSRQFGKKAVIRVWDLNTKTYEDVPTKTYTDEAHKKKDWLYSARIHGDIIGYGMNHMPHVSEQNRPQGWDYNIVTKEYTPGVPESDRKDIVSHGTTSHSGKQVGYFRPGLCYRPGPGKPLIYIGGLGGDGHMAFLYQDKIAVSGDVSSEGLITMILPDTRNVMPVSYSQNVFSGYYGSIVFVSMSPDVTKLAFTSDMLGYRDMYWGIMNFPQPPRNVRTAKADRGILVQWDRPEWSAELRGYLVYRSAESGKSYELVTPKPVQGTEYLDADAEIGKGRFYVVRSVEHSGIASRSFSSEAAWAGNAKRRIYFEAEYFESQEVPFRLRADRSAVNEKYMRILPVNEEPKAGVGKLAYKMRVPKDGAYTLWARVKRAGGSGADCRLTARLAEGTMDMPVRARAWTWQAFLQTATLRSGEIPLAVTGRGEGLSIDRFLLTNDAAFTCSGVGSDVDTIPPKPVNGLKAVETGHFHIRLTWPASRDPELQYYQVYRKRGAGVEAKQTHLVGSPGKADFLDYNLRQGESYSYTVTAVDNWGNESNAAPVLSVKTKPLAKRVVNETDLTQLPDLGWKPEALPEDKSRKVLRVRFEKDSRKQALSIPFDVPVDGKYAIWLRGVPENAGFAGFTYRVDKGVEHYCHLAGPEYKKGQSNLERIQWERLMAFRKDAGTKWPLSKGKHTLTIKPVRRRSLSLILEKVLVTNDFSYIPPGKRFLR